MWITFVSFMKVGRRGCRRKLMVTSIEVILVTPGSSWDFHPVTRITLMISTKLGRWCADAYVPSVCCWYAASERNKSFPRVIYLQISTSAVGKCMWNCFILGLASITLLKLPRTYAVCLECCSGIDLCVENNIFVAANISNIYLFPETETEVVFSTLAM